MKKVLLLAIFVMASFVVKAQDVIVLQSAEEIQAKITSITQDAVTYKRWSNLEGPSYTIDKSQVFYIKYQNGEKDVMTTTNEKPRDKSSHKSANLIPAEFRGYTHFGAVFNGDGAGPTFDITAGVKIYEYCYAGVATGFHTFISSGYFEPYIPVGANLKGYFTRNRKVNPFIDCTLGGFFGIADLSGFNGFHCQVGAGLDSGRFSVSVGFNGLVKYGCASSGYVKLGVRFGK
jgi:hypothetical protein